MILFVETKQYVAFGWDREHIQLLEQMATKGVEPIRSLGHDSPLALDTDRRNIADFIKESVAVVTNPAMTVTVKLNTSLHVPYLESVQVY